MTSGQFSTVPVESIWIDRDGRQRRELTGIDELADSISRTGLIHPPVIRRTGELVAGERRVTAIRQLGWTHIPVQYIEDLSETEVHLIELEENIRRVDISWQDQCLAVDEYHRLHATAGMEWTTVKTAQALGTTVQDVNQKRDIAKELASGNTRIAEAPRYSTARGLIQRSNERKKAAMLREIEPEEEEESERPPIQQADFAEWARTYSGPPFNLIHCDFPYGVNADKHNQGAAPSFGGYRDDYDTYSNLLNVLADAMSPVVAPSAHLMFWFSLDYYWITLCRLKDMGWSVNPFPLIWHKGNIGVLPDPNRGPRRCYETCFLASRGDRKIVRAVSNIVFAPPTKDVHMSEKSLVMLQHFMTMLVDESSTVLDPTCGSGNALKAARNLNASRVLGLELNPEFVELAKENWSKGLRTNAPVQVPGDAIADL